jgi:hypothetical protein
MRLTHIAILLAACALLTACRHEVNRKQVADFIDTADAAARKRFAPEICKLRGKNFTMSLRFHGYEPGMEPTEMKIDRSLYCQQAGSFSRLRQYRLERKSMDIDISTDRKTATVTAEYIETMPYFEPGTMPVTPDDFQKFQVVESRDQSVVGTEDGDLKFLSTESEARQSLIGKSTVNIPYQ